MFRLMTFILLLALFLGRPSMAQTEEVLLCSDRPSAERLTAIAQVFGFNASQTVKVQLMVEVNTTGRSVCAFRKVKTSVLSLSPLMTLYPALNPDNKTRFGIVRVLFEGVYYWKPTSFLPDESVGSPVGVAMLVLDRLDSLLPTDKVVQTRACLYREDIELMVMTRQVLGLRGAEALEQRMMRSTNAGQPTRCFYVDVNLATIPPSSVVTIYPALNTRGVTVGVVEVPMRGFPRVWSALRFYPVPEPDIIGRTVLGKKP